MRIQEPLQRGLARILRHALRQMRHDDPEVRTDVSGTDLQKSGLVMADINRLLPIDDVHLPGEAAHQMLRPLEHEVPSQVRKTDQGRGLRIRRRVLGFELHWDPGASQHFRSILLVKLAHE